MYSMSHKNFLLKRALNRKPKCGTPWFCPKIYVLRILSASRASQTRIRVHMGPVPTLITHTYLWKTHLCSVQPKNWLESLLGLCRTGPEGVGGCIILSLASEARILAFGQHAHGLYKENQVTCSTDRYRTVLPSFIRVRSVAPYSI